MVAIEEIVEAENTAPAAAEKHDEATNDSPTTKAEDESKVDKAEPVEAEASSANTDTTPSATEKQKDSTAKELTTTEAAAANENEAENGATLVNDDSKAEAASPTAASEKPSKEKKQDDEWERLMGEDLLFKVLNPQPGSNGDSDSSQPAQAVQPQDTVVIDFIGRLAETPDVEDGPIFHQVTDWTIVVSEKDVLPSVELATRFLSLGQTGVVWSHSKFAYGVAQRRYCSAKKDEKEYVLPAEANVMYTITVKEIIQDPSTAANQVKVAHSKKTIGNDIYANEWYGDWGKQRAKQQYKRASEMMLYLLQTINADEDNGANAKDPVDAELKKQAETIMVDCLNNIAAIHLRCKEYKLAKEAAVKVLTHQPSNFKALIRAAKACLLDPASSYEEVEAALQAAAAEADDANEKDLQKLRAQFRRRKEEYKAKSKAMFSKIGKATSPTPAMEKEQQQNNEASDPPTTSSNAAIEEGDETSKQLEPSPDEPTTAEPATSPNTPQAGTKDDGIVRNAKDDGFLNWRSWPWRKRIIPYGFQVALSFTMYFIFTILKKKQDALLLQQQTMGAEGDSPGGDEF